MGKSASVEVIEHASWVGFNVEHCNAVVEFCKASHNGHLPVTVECEVLQTITYLFDGEILHRDSLGYVQAIQPGAVNWMTAGRGIVHSEKVTDEVLASGQFLHGIQTWVAVPTELEEVEPAFDHYPADAIPRTELPGVVAQA